LAGWNFPAPAALWAAALIFSRINYRVGLPGVAVLGARLGFPSRTTAATISSLTRFDLLLAFAALAMVRLLVYGIRRAH